MNLPRLLSTTMNHESVTLTFLDGPTLLIEFGGLRILTDPTFDSPQTYSAGYETLKKLNPSPVSAESLLPIDVVLLSHDQHFDNLDISGRAFLPSAGLVLSTCSAAGRLGGNTRGLEPWASARLPLPDGRTMTITGVPARHGPFGVEAITGEVTGFVLSIDGWAAVYVSGDTVWFEGTAEVAERFDIGVAILFAGAAQPRGPFDITMDTNGAIEAARAFPHARIVGVHNQGWSHYVQSQNDLARAFELLGIAPRLLALSPVVPQTVALGHAVVKRAQSE